MHMADALLAPAVAATMYVASGTAAGISINKLRKDDEPQKLPVMAVTAALVFAGQMINYTIPGTGSSGLSITEIAAVTSRPAQVIGMHFFNPVPAMKLVEVVKGIATSDEVKDAVVAATESLK